MDTTNTHQELKELKLAMDSLSVYRGLLKDKVIGRLYALVDYLEKGTIELGSFINLYNDFFYDLISHSRHSLKEYMIDAVISSENPFSLMAQREDFNCMDDFIGKAASMDLYNLEAVSNLSSSIIKYHAKKCFMESIYESSKIELLPEWGLDCLKKSDSNSFLSHIRPVIEIFLNRPWNECIQPLADFHRKHGCGLFALHRAFTWENRDGAGYLKAVNNPDLIQLSDMVGYENERSKIMENTKQFLNGFPANNVLIYGDRGTGKSSTVKAILNEYCMDGLRIIEVPKKHLSDFPAILGAIKNSLLKFIIFVDDLAFEDGEESYTALKAILEGGLESKPYNVLIYATSNRRHLVKERFSEREGLNSGNHSQEVYAGDTMQEKLSLADRFGITVVFTAPDKKRYLQIVQGIAANRGLNVDSEVLQSEALKWEVWYNGRSPRTARQFVDWLEGYQGMQNQ